jgi:hypothetical protein
MSQFQYFIPGPSIATPSLLAERGLVSLVGGTGGNGAIAKLISRVTGSGGRGVSNGPGGQNGVIVGQEIEGYYADRQTWVPAPQGDADVPPYWVGYASDLMPTVESLAREQLLPGKPITFRDGSVWNVPTLCNWHEGAEVPVVWTTPLPMMVDIDRYGQAIDGPVVPEYRDLFDVGLKILARIVAGKDDSDVPITNTTLMQFAADVLGCNYRVSLLELSFSVMDRLSTEDAMRVVESAIDMEGYWSALGNWAGRQGRPVTDTDSGSAA